MSGRDVPQRRRALSVVANILVNLFWAVILSALIWLYAEREQSQRETLLVPVSTSMASGDWVCVSPRQSVEVSLAGPRVSIDRVRDWLKTEGALGIRVPTDAVDASGKAALPAVELMRGHALFSGTGIQIDRCWPAQVVVAAERVSWQSVRLDLRAPESSSFAWSLSAANVRAKAPESSWRSLRSSRGDLSIPVDVSSLLVGREDREFSDKLPLKAPAGLSMEFDPGSVVVTRKLVQQLPFHVIVAVPVWVSAPPDFLEQWQVVNLQSVKDLRVRGPQEQIELIKSGQFPVRVRLEVTREEHTTGEHDKQLLASDFVLPPGVVLDQPAPTVRFKLARRGE